MVCRDASECAGGLAWPYCACARFFPPEDGNRWSWHHLETSLSFCLHRGLGVYKGECTWAGGWLSGSFGSCTSKWPLEKPPTLCGGYFGASQGVRVQLTGKCSSFVQLHVPKIILGTLNWCWFSCLQVNWVVCHLISLGSCIGVAQIATFWVKWHTQDKSIQCPHQPVKVWFGSRSCDRSQPSLKLPYPVVCEGWWLPFPRLEVSPHLLGNLLVAYKLTANHHG